MIKIATQNDTRVLAELAIQMWSNHTVSELDADFAKIVNDNDAVCFIKYVDDIPVGFAQCQLRYDYVEGTHSSPVGYLEGIFIVPEHQHKGYAKELLCECELWAKEKGCSEFASDCELENKNSYSFHIAMGFEEANRVICFKKELK
ncbi:MAG: GNAT family N-acetyltransferase [Clostridia bacterium]|nr:GNAT family N-acetyltransferase [Clostridia bacterium]